MSITWLSFGDPEITFFFGRMKAHEVEFVQQYTVILGERPWVVTHVSHRVPLLFSSCFPSYLSFQSSIWRREGEKWKSILRSSVFTSWLSRSNFLLSLHDCLYGRMIQFPLSFPFPSPNPSSVLEDDVQSRMFCSFLAVAARFFFCWAATFHSPPETKWMKTFFTPPLLTFDCLTLLSVWTCSRRRRIARKIVVLAISSSIPV